MNIYPKISIVTPSFNQGKFIRETIDSVLTQDYTNLEYWVIDGGSTDDTVAILKEYDSDDRFNWISEPDTGQSNAINKGWARCTGDVFAWLNSDDTYCDGALSKVAETFGNNAGIRGAYGECIYTDESGTPWRQFMQGAVTKEQVLNLSCSIDQPTIFVCAELIKQYGMTDESFHHQMDYELWTRLGFPTKFIYIPAFLATWRAHNDTKSISNPKRAGDELKRIIDQAENNHYDLTVMEIQDLQSGAKRRMVEYFLADNLSFQNLLQALNHSVSNPSDSVILGKRIIKTAVRNTAISVGISNDKLRRMVEGSRRRLKVGQ